MYCKQLFNREIIAVIVLRLRVCVGGITLQLWRLCECKTFARVIFATFVRKVSLRFCTTPVEHVAKS